MTLNTKDKNREHKILTLHKQKKKRLKEILKEYQNGGKKKQEEEPRAARSRGDPVVESWTCKQEIFESTRR
jgi:low affinity Fe/Cu permease